MEENTAKIYISGVIGEDTTLLDVMRQFKSYSKPTSVEVLIDSFGGSVEQGKAIFNYLRKLNVPVKTVAEMAYSISAHIFMAGDERVVREGDARLMIHFPWASMSGSSEDFDAMSKELKKTEQEFIKFYSAYLQTDESAIATLLKNETFISGEDALTLGFATTLEKPFKAVAFYDIQENEKNDNNPKNETIMSKVQNLLNALTAFVNNEKEENEEVNALILQDAEGTEINFPDVAEDGTPEIGDRAEVDGSPAEGEFVAPDGSTWVFAEGALTEIRPAEEESEEDEEEANADAEAEAEIQKMLQELFGKAKEDAMKELQGQFSKIKEDLEAEIVALKKLVGSPDLEEEEEEDAPKGRKSLWARK